MCLLMNNFNEIMFWDTLVIQSVFKLQWIELILDNKPTVAGSISQAASVDTEICSDSLSWPALLQQLHTKHFCSSGLEIKIYSVHL